MMMLDDNDDNDDGIRTRSMNVDIDTDLSEWVPGRALIGAVDPRLVDLANAYLHQQQLQQQVSGLFLWSYLVEFHATKAPRLSLYGSALYKSL